ncbi:hypothetical protein BQ8482_111091 [Mesorhizobium delmotii]|uniref:Uncharacterized protein n=1 Tax=Mesorhizobium delmotii TaxID=1631247 RepID=A0A2P9ADG6_9HYPH|nr:hypothetical protein BQ8482_111091 [Mesorhizobium delmotii]
MHEAGYDWVETENASQSFDDFALLGMFCIGGVSRE